MSEKLDFFKKLKPRLPSIEKDSLYERLVHAAQENLLLEEALKAIEEGIVLLNEKGVALFANPAAEKWLDLQIRPEKKQPLWIQLQDPALSAFLKENLFDLKSRVVNDFKVLSPQERTLRLTLLPREQDGNKTILMILADITSRTEQELEAVLLSRMESLVRLAGGIAHEIGNPLNTITIHLELLKKRLAGLPAAKQQELERSLNDIQDETRRLDRIIKNFLKATRKPPLRFRLDSLNEILDDALNFLKPQLEKNKIRTQLAKDAELPAFLMDRERLYSAFLNLIKNAMESMPKGGLLKVTVAHKDHCATVAVTDTGCGIPEPDLPHIFDIYYTTKTEGAGLGLMMVFDAITEHGGKIEVVSKLKKGTTFKVLLPIREPQLQLPHY